jgi:arylsulfatase A
MRNDKALFNGAVPAVVTHPWSWVTGIIAGPNSVGDPNKTQIDYSPDMIAEVEAWLNNRATDPNPFFAYVALYSPHTPHLPTPAFQGSVGFTYGDFLHETDDWIGRIIAAIDSNSQLENTIVVLTSDNGIETGAQPAGLPNGQDGNGPFRGVKRDGYEGGGARVPFIVRWPGKIKPASVSNELIWQGDIYSTTAAVIDVAIPQGQAPDGESFLHVLQGQSKPAFHREFIATGSMSNQLSLRTLDGWKFIDGPGSGGYNPTYSSTNTWISQGSASKQLYDLTSDLGENTNLQASNTAKYNELLARLNVYKKTPSSLPTDSDSDGMSDAFETFYGLNLNDPLDAA